MRRESFLQGAVILAVAGIVSKILGLIYRFPLARLIGDEGIGLTQLVYSLYQVLLAISTLGLPIAISKLVADRVARKRYRAAYQVFKLSAIMLAGTGLLFSVGLAVGARFFAERIYHEPRAYLSIIAIAPAVFFVAVMSSLRGFFQGLKSVIPTGVSEVIEQMARVATSLTLAILLLPRGVAYAAAGAAFGAVTGGMAGLIYLVALFLSVRRRLAAELGGGEWGGGPGAARGGGAGGERVAGALPERSESGLELARAIVRLAIPVSLASLVLPLMQFADSAIVTTRLQVAGFGVEQATGLFGQLSGMAFSLINVPAMITFALAVSLVPTISEATALGNAARARALLTTGLRITNILVLPAVVGLYLLAGPICVLIFSNRAAGLPLAVLSGGLLFLGLQQTTSGALQGVGRTDLPVRNLVIGAVIKVALTWWLTAKPAFGIAGAALASDIGFLVAATLNVAAARHHVGIDFSFRALVAKPVIAAVAMGLSIGPVFGLAKSLLGREDPATLVTILIAATLYFIVLLLIGGLKSGDFEMIPGAGRRLAAKLERLGLLRG